MVVSKLIRQGYQHVQTACPTGFGESGQVDLFRQFTNGLGQFDHVFERRRFGIKIEHTPVGVFEMSDAAVPGVNWNGAHIGQVYQCRGILDDEVVNLPRSTFAPQHLALNPIRHEVGRISLVKRLTVNTVGIPR